MKSGPVTMQDVAKAAKVARSTVSKALRDDPTIPPSTRESIRVAAEHIGYRPHPLVAALMAQLHTRRRRNDPQHLAWIDLWTKDAARAMGHNPANALRGAHRRAQELGYSIEEHRVTIDGISPARLRQILLARSQWGLIFPPAPESAMHYPFDLTGLAAVAIGTSLRQPRMHRVAHNHYQSGQLACRRLRASGYRRIGLVVSPWNDARVDGRWRAAYVLEQSTWPEEERLPPLLAGSEQPESFLPWFRRHRPDVIIAAEAYVAQWLREAGARAAQTPVAWLALENFKANAWGIDYRSEQLGAAAVELVIGQIHRHERGSPETPHSLLIDGVWIGQ